MGSDNRQLRLTMSWRFYNLQKKQRDNLQFFGDVLLHMYIKDESTKHYLHKHVQYDLTWWTGAILGHLTILENSFYLGFYNMLAS
eukprot:537174-Amphidinium_carterae.6